jgi:hypothetical protein
LWVRDKTGVIPNLPVRCCEYMMGRISLSALAAIVAIHFVTFYSTGYFVQQVFSDWTATVTLQSIEYDDAENPWIVVCLA